MQSRAYWYETRFENRKRFNNDKGEASDTEDPDEPKEQSFWETTGPLAAQT